MLFMQKERNLSEYINFITYQDDAIYQCPLHVITEEEDIRNRRETFIRETGTEKTVLITMITSYGLAPGGYSDDIQCQLTMADLFRYKPTSQKW